ncbi:MAG: glycerol-3-phosphate 1-O-acyltransferase PlsY [Patescibacteria group bacterium]|nr:glycerol-3-phosphate 1-O-acyltransferase PlsY [Patescibacteria group bacterium]
MSIIEAFFLIALAYLVGAFSTGYFLGTLKGINLREKGSGSTGATNVVRNLGWGLGVVAFIVDLAKAMAMILLVREMTNSPFMEMLCGLAVVAGNCWSVYFKSPAGKGVTSSLGVMLLFSPFPTLGGLLVAIVLVVAKRYVSLGSLVGATTVLLLVLAYSNYYFLPLEYRIFAFLAWLVILLRHADNIGRLALGTERKLGQKETVEG